MALFELVQPALQPWSAHAIGNSLHKIGEFAFDGVQFALAHFARTRGLRNEAVPLGSKFLNEGRNVLGAHEAPAEGFQHLSL